MKSENFKHHWQSVEFCPRTKELKPALSGFSTEKVKELGEHIKNCKVCQKEVPNIVEQVKKERPSKNLILFAKTFGISFALFGLGGLLGGIEKAIFKR